MSYDAWKTAAPDLDAHERTPCDRCGDDVPGTAPDTYEDWLCAACMYFTRLGEPPPDHRREVMRMLLQECPPSVADFPFDADDMRAADFAAVSVAVVMYHINDIGSPSYYVSVHETLHAARGWVEEEYNTGDWTFFFALDLDTQRMYFAHTTVELLPSREWRFAKVIPKGSVNGTCP